jgi:ADP-ribose pyrophosphatase YjhB (NUDIX family)
MAQDGANGESKPRSPGPKPDRQAPKQQAAGKQPAARQAGKQGGKPANKQANKQAGKPATKQPAKQAAKQAGKHPRKRRSRWLRQVDEFSAGGLVLDLEGEVPRGALIARTDRHGRLLWSLPKGHIEAGETAEQAAVREVEEETGIAGEIVAELGTIDFWFVADGRRIHKTVRHYLLRRTGGELSDADIEVDEVAWVPLSTIREQLAYPDERGLVDTAGRLLADTA